MNEIYKTGDCVRIVFPANFAHRKSFFVEGEVKAYYSGGADEQARPRLAVTFGYGEFVFYTDDVEEIFILAKQK